MSLPTWLQELKDAGLHKRPPDAYVLMDSGVAARLIRIAEMAEKAAENCSDVHMCAALRGDEGEGRR